MLARMNVKPASLWNEFSDMEHWLSAANGSANGQVESTSRWVPTVDVVEQQDKYVLTADLPGIERKDIEIIFEDGTLTLQGERSQSVDSDHDGYQRVERSYGSFQRTFRLPDNIDAESITAKSEHGVLEVRVPKKEKAQKKIEVQ